MMKRSFPSRSFLRQPANIVLAIIIGLFGSTADASVVWNWMTTDGTDVATGQLITDGLEADALEAGNPFALLSIESVALNGTLITAWDSAGAGPPFNDPAFGVLESQGGGAGDFFSGDTGLFGFDSAFANTVSIGKPGVANSTAGYDASSANHYNFVPTATTFTVQSSVPEPTACILLVVALLGLSCLSLRRE